MMNRSFTVQDCENISHFHTQTALLSLSSIDSGPHTFYYFHLSIYQRNSIIVFVLELISVCAESFRDCRAYRSRD
jgi:hypothetical protein